jgi:hypothetical protein
MVSFQLLSTIRYDPDLPGHTRTSTYPEPKDSPYYLLAFHHDRLLAAARSFIWGKAVAELLHGEGSLASLTRILDAHIPDPTTAWRLRVLLDKEGIFTVETTPTTPFSDHLLVIPESEETAGQTMFSSLCSSSAVWKLKLDTQATETSLFTRLKTTERTMYTAARERAGIQSPRETTEVLLYNENGEVMDGSITTVYFKRRRYSGQLEQRSVEDASDAGAWVTPALTSGANAATSRRYAFTAGLCVEEPVRVADLVNGEQVWLSNGLRGFMKAVLEL